MTAAGRRSKALRQPSWQPTLSTTTDNSRPGRRESPVEGLYRHVSTPEARYGSEGWGFESLRARLAQESPVHEGCPGEWGAVGVGCRPFLLSVFVTGCRGIGWLPAVGAPSGGF